MRENLGPAILNGEIRYFSPSSLSLLDPNQFGGCPRRYWFKYVAGKKEPEKGYQQLGTQIHAEIEQYIKTGVKALSRHALAGEQFITPLVGRSVLVEHSINDGLLTAAGVPVVGFIDVVNGSGYYVDPLGQLREDQCIELKDWKSTGNLAYVKNGADLLKTIQMPAYAEWSFRKYGGDRARLSHVYFCTKKPSAVKTTISTTREKNAARWQEIEGVARLGLDIVRETECNKVPANRSSCDAYGGCPHRSYCPAAYKNLDEIFGTIGENMGVLDGIMNQGNGVQAQMAALQAAEQQAAPAPAKTPFQVAVESIKASGKGFPQLAGEAAQAYAAILGLEKPAPGAGYAGSGFLGAVCLDTVQKVVQAAEELAQFTNDSPGIEPVAVGLTPPPVSGIIPVDAPGALASPPPEAPKAKKPRAKKADAPAPVAALQVQPLVVPSPAVPMSSTVTEGERRVLVDCITNFDGAKSLDAYVQIINDAICKQYGVPDMRCASGDHELAYGKWRGIVSQAVKANPPPPGTWTLDTRGREIAECIADALVSVSTFYVRGIR